MFMKIRNFTALSLLGICCFLLTILINAASIDEHKAAVNSDMDLLKSVIILSPGKVIAYAHNKYTNQALMGKGVKVLAFLKENIWRTRWGAILFNHAPGKEAKAKLRDGSGDIDLSLGFRYI
jgi:hypothetical protein